MSAALRRNIHAERTLCRAHGQASHALRKSDNAHARTLRAIAHRRRHQDGLTLPLSQGRRRTDRSCL